MLGLLRERLTNEQIADRLGISLDVFTLVVDGDVTVSFARPANGSTRTAGRVVFSSGRPPGAGLRSALAGFGLESGVPAGAGV